MKYLIVYDLTDLPICHVDGAELTFDSEEEAETYRGSLPVRKHYKVRATDKYSECTT